MSVNPGQIIFKFVKDWTNAAGVKDRAAVLHYQQIAWTPPPVDWIKLNVDGSMSTESGSITAGGVLRDHSNAWLGGFSLRKGVGSVQEAEFWGLFEGLQLAWRAGYRRIKVETDSKNSVNILENPISLNHPLYSLIQNCKALMEEDWCCSISHAFRESNKVADCLARLGHSLDLGVTFFVDPPPQVLDLLKNDAASLAVTRLVPLPV